MQHNILLLFKLYHSAIVLSYTYVLSDTESWREVSIYLIFCVLVRNALVRSQQNEEMTKATSKKWCL